MPCANILKYETRIRKNIVDSAALWITLRVTHIAWTTLRVVHTLHNFATIVNTSLR